MEKIELNVYKWSRTGKKFLRHCDGHNHHSFKTICFTHRVDSSLCHCKTGRKKFVSCKMRIPKKNSIKEWNELEESLLDKGEDLDITVFKSNVNINNLDDKQKLLYRLLDIKPKITSFYLIN